MKKKLAMKSMWVFWYTGRFFGIISDWFHDKQFALYDKYCG